MARAIRDRFANVAAIAVTQTGANILTFGALATNMGFLGRRDQALAMVIDEIQWSPDPSSFTQIDAEADIFYLALTTSNVVSDLEDLTDRRILANLVVGRADFGTAASGQIFQTPIVKQFFPPLITAERTLYLAVDSDSITAAFKAYVRILYRVETLTSAELVELAETFRLTG